MGNIERRVLTIYVGHVSTQSLVIKHTCEKCAYYVQFHRSGGCFGYDLLLYLPAKAHAFYVNFVLLFFKRKRETAVPIQVFQGMQ